MPTNSNQTLWELYINKSNIDDNQKGKIKQIGTYFFKDVSLLYKIYSLTNQKDIHYMDEKTNITFGNEKDSYILRKDDITIVLKQDDMRRFISDMITLFEEILPLGTVVDLKKDKLLKNIETPEIENLRVVITQRFIGAKEGCFYPYGAVLYPLGAAGGKLISFTPALIEKVIHTGYRDDMEDEFVFQMKHSLVIEQKRKSAGFATQHELEEAAEHIRKTENMNER